MVSPKRRSKKAAAVAPGVPGGDASHFTPVRPVGLQPGCPPFSTVEAVSFGENEPLQQIVSAAVKLAQEDFSNLTQILGMVDPFGNALPLQKAYRACTDFAFK